jgi:hypothetical protein
MISSDAIIIVIRLERWLLLLAFLNHYGRLDTLKKKNRGRRNFAFSMHRCLLIAVILLVCVTASSSSSSSSFSFFLLSSYSIAISWMQVLLLFPRLLFFPWRCSFVYIIGILIINDVAHQVKSIEDMKKRVSEKNSTQFSW